MTTSHLLSILSLSLVWLTACTQQAPAEPKTQAPRHTTEPHDPALESQPMSAHAELDALDPRTPVPLQPMMAWHQKQNMQNHLVAIEQITGALPSQDWPKIIKASEEIGTSPAMQQMCEHMGAGAPGFTDMALEFHRRADGIAEAARSEWPSGGPSDRSSRCSIC